VNRSTFNLVHSPFAGPSTWRPVEERLRRQGLATWRGQVTFETLLSVDEYTMDDEVDPDPAVLVVHSAAGLFSPTLQSRPSGPVIFVDAILPAPGRSWFACAPTPLAAHLTRLATGGVLPPWSTWFGASTMARLLPDEPVRAAFEAECPSVRLDVLWVPTADMPLQGARHAYLRLSEGYADEAQQAQALGWLVRHEPLHHLAMLTHPDRIADLIRELAQEL
jgi:hypothetical protein